MFKIKKFNIITGENKQYVFKGANIIFEFMDLNGKNILVFDGDFNSHFSNKFKTYNFTKFNDFKSIIKSDGVLFRADIVVIINWNISKDQFLDYKEFLNKIELPCILISKNSIYKSSDDLGYFKISARASERVKNFGGFSYNEMDYLLTDINNNTSNIDDIIELYKRSIKLKQILKRK